MSALPPIVKFESTDSTVCYSENLLDLTEIYKPDVNICVVKRAVSDELETFIEHLLSESRALNVIENIHVKTFDAQKFLPSQFYHVEGCAEFCADILHLIDVFSHLFELENVGLRFGMLDKAMCPKFHVDHVPCRLVCTYGGIGTEFLQDTLVNRAKLGSGSGGLSDDVSGLIKGDMDAISTMPAYGIGLLKGSKWEG
ncbi:MAG: DUF1826 domain-containing protein, partial [Methylococcaceae bacterium]